MSFLHQLHQNFQQIQSKRPLSLDEKKELKKWFDVAYTYHTNALEGNTLTLSETKILLEDGITIGGKQMREIFEATNHYDALQTMYADLKEKKNISEEMLLAWHGIIMEKILEKPGEYRNVQMFISGSSDVLPNAKDIPTKMKIFCQELPSFSDDFFVRAAWIHWNIAKIHPFLDGNGRMARLAMNFELLKNGGFPVIIPIIRREEYIASFKNFEIHSDFLFDVMLQNGKDYVRMIEE